jgi:hypothetical protein
VIYRCANSFGIEFDLKEVDITKKGYKNLWGCYDQIIQNHVYSSYKQPIQEKIA